MTTRQLALRCNDKLVSCNCVENMKEHDTPPKPTGDTHLLYLFPLTHSISFCISLNPSFKAQHNQRRWVCFWFLSVGEVFLCHCFLRNAMCDYDETLKDIILSWCRIFEEKYSRVQSRPALFKKVSSTGAMKGKLDWLNDWDLLPESKRLWVCVCP